MFFSNWMGFFFFHHRLLEHNTSPDDVAQVDISSAYSRYAGPGSSSTHTKPYDTGTMNEKVYYVRGGMEDWAYAGKFFFFLNV